MINNLKILKITIHKQNKLIHHKNNNNKTKKAIQIIKINVKKNFEVKY